LTLDGAAGIAILGVELDGVTRRSTCPQPPSGIAAAPYVRELP